MPERDSPIPGLEPHYLGLFVFTYLSSTSILSPNRHLMSAPAPAETSVVQAHVQQQPSLQAELGALAVLGDARGSFPWQQSIYETSSTDAFYFTSLRLNEIPGLTLQLRGTLVQAVSNLHCRFRKIAGGDYEYRVFVTSEHDFHEAADLRKLDEYMSTFPTARVQYTLNTDTSGSTLDFPVEWPVGVGNTVNRPLPPAHPPLIVVYVKGDDLAGKRVSFELSGQVDVRGWGHVSYAIPAKPATKSSSP
jgi:hypothetical protein